MRAFITTALLLVASAAAAQTASSEATAEVESSDGGFRIVMPCRPDPRPDATVAGLVLYSCSSASGFFARVSSLPVIVLGEVDAELNDEIGLAVDDLMEGRVVKDEPITVGRYRGRAFRANAAGGLVTVNRIFVAEDRNRLYHVMAAASGDSVPEERIEAFLNSFAFVDTAAADVTHTIITARVTSKMNRLLPAPIDRDTELLFTVGLQGVVAYQYRLTNLELPQVDVAKFLATMRTAMINSSCQIPRLRDGILGQGLLMRHVYSDRDLKQVGTFDVSVKDCLAPAPAQ